MTTYAGWQPRIYACNIGNPHTTGMDQRESSAEPSSRRFGTHLMSSEWAPSSFSFPFVCRLGTGPLYGISLGPLSLLTQSGLFHSVINISFNGGPFRVARIYRIYSHNEPTRIMNPPPTFVLEEILFFFCVCVWREHPN